MGNFMRYCTGDGITLENIIVLPVVSKCRGYTVSQDRPSQTLATLAPQYPSFSTAPIPMKGGDGWKQQNPTKTQTGTRGNRNSHWVPLQRSCWSLSHLLLHGSWLTMLLCSARFLYLQSVLFLEDPTSQAP